MYAIKVINWFETHPQTVSIIDSVIKVIIPCLFATGLVRFLFKGAIENRNKRIEAEASLFPVLRRSIMELKEKLQDYGRLDESSEKTNIFILLYSHELRRSNFGYFEYDPETKNKYEHDYYKDRCMKIKKLIDESSCNVPAKKASKKDWYDNQHILVDFCDFIIEIENRNENNSAGKLDSLEDSLHVSKCKELSNTLNYFIENLAS